MGASPSSLRPLHSSFCIGVSFVDAFVIPRFHHQPVPVQKVSSTGSLLQLAPIDNFNTDTLQSDEYGPLDYAITDSTFLPGELRPPLIQSISNPRDALAVLLLSCGLVVSYFNVVGDYSDAYQKWQRISIVLGLASFVAVLVQLQTGDMISARPRMGVIDDAVMNWYAGMYSGCVTWLALRTSTFCPSWVETLDGVAPWIAAAVFTFSLAAPIITLLENNNAPDGVIANITSLSATMTRFARLATSISPTSKSNGGVSRIPIPSVLSDTELFRTQGLLAIGVLGCVFVPDCVAFALGGSEWWDRVAVDFPSQRLQESSTALFALYATEASMVATRCANKGVAPYRVMVPAFAGVCLLLAIIPCVCSLYWLGDGVSFFSFYRE